MSAAGEWIDATLQAEGSSWRADAERERLGSSLIFYGASVGAVRGTIRDARKRYRGLTHDDVTALSSELWAGRVYECRLAVIVLLQSRVGELVGTDLTRIEGFVRDAGQADLVELLARDVVAPLVDSLTGHADAGARLVIERWASDGDRGLRRAARVVREASSRP